jgi:sucrose-6-phosphate hydrolase SacC (GH32 family)
VLPGTGYQLRVLVDRTSLEIFADQGLVYMPLPIISDPQNREISFFARGGKAGLQADVHELKSIWKP